MDNISNSYTAQEDRIHKVNITNIIFRWIIIFLLFFIVSSSIIAVGVFKKLPYIPKDISSTILETLVCSNCTDLKEDEDEDVGIKNSGWSLFTNPKYSFSVELPNMVFYNDEIDNKQEYPYMWNIQFYKKDIYIPDTFPYYDMSANISFKPTHTPQGYECDEGCLGDSSIKIDFYNNTENFSSLEVENKLKEYVSEKQKDFNESNECSIVQGVFWGESGFKYETMLNGTQYTGSILLTDKYIIEVKEYIHSKGEELEIVNKVIDSIYFR